MAKKPEEDPNEAKKMPLLDHLIELRTRLLWAAYAVIAAFIGCWFISQQMFDFLAQPLADILLRESGGSQRLIATGMAEVFFTRVKLSFFGALTIAFPVIAAQLWAFVAPGLYKNEKGAFLPFLVATPFLFLLGASLLYYVMLPFAWEFFLSLQTTGDAHTLKIQLEARVGEYVTLVMTLIFAFGFCFQLPVLLMLLTRTGMTSSEGLKTKRKYAIVAIFVVAAVVTPPDPISQLSLAIPLCLLYEVSIWASRFVERQRDRREKELDEELEQEPGQSVSKNPAE